AIHGLVRYELFRVAETKEADESGMVALLCRTLRPGIFEGYEFSVDVKVTFTLCERALFLKIEGTNVGKGAAPFGCGWHPYFKTSDKGIEHLRLTVPAQNAVITDERMLPIAGKSAFCSLGRSPEIDFRPNRPSNGNVIGNRKLDQCYHALITDENGYSHTLLEDPENGVRIRVSQKGGLMHVYTGDTLPARSRKSIALEPVELMTNAFNRPACAGHTRLEPAETRGFDFGVNVE
ncbi:unnamed protein product, partial [marine sediment metagenome]